MAEAIDPNGISKIIRDLLRIAKVAMPQKLYAEDPRVLTAMAFLKHVEGSSTGGRPPNITSRPPNFDIHALTTRRVVEQSARGISFLTDLGWDLVRAMTAAQGDLLPIDPSDALNFVLRDWLVAHGYLAPPPEDPS